MLADLFPWSLLLPLALWWAARERSRTRSRDSSSSGLRDRGVLLSVGHERGPVHPADRSSGSGADRRHARGRRSRARRSGGRSLVSARRRCCCSCGMSTHSGFSAFAAVCSRRSARSSGAALLSGGARRVGRGSPATGVLAATATLAGSLVISTWCVVLCTLPDFERYKPVRPFCRDHPIARQRRRHRRVVQILAAEHGLLPASAGHGGRASRSSSSGVPLDQRHLLCDARRRNTEASRTGCRCRRYVLARQPMFDLKPINFLEGTELDAVRAGFESCVTARSPAISAAHPTSTCSATRDRDGRPLRTTICRRCGLVWSNPRPAEDEVRRYYSREYRLDYKGRATPSLRHIARSGRGALNRYRELAPQLEDGRSHARCRRRRRRSRLRSPAPRLRRVGPRAR